MKEWENQLGQLEKASEMTEDDFQVESNIVLYENAKNDPRSFTRHVEETLNELRAVSFVLIIDYWKNFQRKQEIEEGMQDNSAKWGTLATIAAIFANYASWSIISEFRLIYLISKLTHCTCYSSLNWCFFDLHFFQTHFLCSIFRNDKMTDPESKLNRYKDRLKPDLSDEEALKLGYSATFWLKLVKPLLNPIKVTFKVEEHWNYASLGAVD